MKSAILSNKVRDPDGRPPGLPRGMDNHNARGDVSRIETEERAGFLLTLY